MKMIYTSAIITDERSQKRFPQSDSSRLVLHQPKIGPACPLALEIQEQEIQSRLKALKFLFILYVLVFREHGR